jgi:excisionase family DNA binding protein
LKKFLNVEEVAEYLNVPKATVRYWCFTKKLRYYKIGRHVRFSKSDMDKFMESSLVERR